MTKTAVLLIGLALTATLGARSAMAGQAAATKAPIPILYASARNQEPPDPCISFHGRAHAHCVAGLAAGKRRHNRLDPYKN
jgi:hypothetical protein